MSLFRVLLQKRCDDVNVLRYDVDGTRGTDMQLSGRLEESVELATCRVEGFLSVRTEAAI